MMYNYVIQILDYDDTNPITIFETAKQDPAHPTLTGTYTYSRNEINQATITIYPDNPGFSSIHLLKTLLLIRDIDDTYKVKFFGRALHATKELDSDGKMCKVYTFEGIEGKMNDCMTEADDTAEYTLESIIKRHASAIKDDTLTKYGVKTVKVLNNAPPISYLTTSNDNPGQQTMWEYVISVISDNGIHIETSYSGDFGNIVVTINVRLNQPKTSNTGTITIGENLISFNQTIDATSVVNHVIPYGALTEVEASEGSEGMIRTARINISSVNDGKDYLEDIYSKARFNIAIKDIYYDDIEDATELKITAQKYLNEHAYPTITTQISAINRSLIGDADEPIQFGCVYSVNVAPLKVSGAFDVTKETQDINDFTASTYEFMSRGYCDDADYDAMWDVNDQLCELHDDGEEEELADENNYAMLG